MGMIIVEDKVHARLNRFKKNKYIKDIHPTGKISHSNIIEAGLDAIDKVIKSEGS